MKPEVWGLYIVDGKCPPMQTDKPARANITDIHHIVVARNCATRRGAHVDNIVYIAVMCAHRMRGTCISNSKLHDFPDNCMEMDEAIARC